MLSILVLTLLVIGASAWAVNKATAPPHDQPATSRREPRTNTITTLGPDGASSSVKLTKLQSDLDGLFRQIALEDYLAGVGRQVVGEFLASIPPPPPPPPPTPKPVYTPTPSYQPAPSYTPPPSSGGACGGATNGADQYIARETNGSADPANQYNLGGSGAWGCYQLMPEHFAPGGTCSDMVYGQASAAQQAECASRLPLSAWGG